MGVSIQAMRDRRPVAVLILASLVVMACERMEMVENVYVTFQDAVKAGAVGDEKWIPVLLPPSATDIREAHNLDTNEVWLFFRLNSADPHFMARQCTRIPEDKLRLARKRPGKWWPERLVQGGERTPSAEAYRHYECGTKSFLSVDAANKVAYYWALG